MVALPAQVLDLKRWKLQLPIGQAEKPTEIKWPTLGTYQHSEYFVTETGGEVRFRAPVNGVTTSGSANPRSELREMNTDGSNASWSSSKGAHELIVVEAFTHLPNPRTDGGNAGVVGAQIHDAKDDVTVFRLEQNKLWVTKGDTAHHALADGDYKLGTTFEARFVVWQDKVRCYYNEKLVTTIPGKFSGAYFKAGCYTQANSKNSKPADASNYGEVLISSVSVLHTTTPPDEPVPVPQPVPQPVPSPTPVPEPDPVPDATVIVVRHGEKPPDSGPPYGVTASGIQDAHSLTTRGWARAGALVNLFNGYSRAMPKPSAIYASKGSTASMRPTQTVQFVANNLGLAPVTRYDLEIEPEFEAMVAEIKARAGVTLVSAEHSIIADFARALTGLSVPVWPDSRFDVCWICTRLDGVWSMRQVPQNLLPGDRTTTF